MSWYKPTTLLDKIFEGGIILKGISGALEFLAGLLLLFVSPQALHNFIMFLTQRENLEDPHDKFVSLLLHSTQHLLASGTTFLLAYLWIHAFIKLIAVIGILRNYMWAYPFSLITLGLLMLYQVYSISIQPSLGMILLTIFDIFILWLISREWGKAKLNLVQVNEAKYNHPA